MIGEIDLATADRLRDELLNVVAVLHPHHIAVDLAEVAFLDCSGVTALVIAGEAAARNGCRIRIDNPRTVVRRVLTLTGLIGGNNRVPLADSTAIPAIPPPRDAVRVIRPGRNDRCDVGV